MACNTSGRTLIVSMNYAVLEIWERFFLLMMQEHKTMLYLPIFWALDWTSTISSTSCPLNQRFWLADRSLLSERDKSFWVQVSPREIHWIDNKLIFRDFLAICCPGYFNSVSSPLAWSFTQIQVLPNGVKLTLWNTVFPPLLTIFMSWLSSYLGDRKSVV